MKARDLMTTPVVTLRADDSVRAAADLLVTRGFTSAPVVDARGHVQGIVTEADLMRGRVVPQGWTVERPDPLLREVMTPAPTSVQPDADVADIVTLMLNSAYRCVPIVEDGRLVGIVTRRDVLRMVADRHLVSRT